VIALCAECHAVVTAEAWTLFCCLGCSHRWIWRAEHRCPKS
jgi:predicted RNA-binding Zn-ribbon protein involved in translation (DUF1610 family)